MQIIITIRLVFIASLFIVFYLSIVPASDIPNFAMLSDITDKAVHAVIYFYLAILGLMSKYKLSEFTMIINIFCFGLIIEIIHIFHPYRFFEYFDLLANLIGVTIALLFFRLKNKINY